MQAVKGKKLLTRAKKLSLAVKPLDLPKPNGKVDEVVNALAGCWNLQAYDYQAFELFQNPWSGFQVLVDRLHDYPEGSISQPGQRELVARILRQFADACYQATEPYIRHD